MTSILFIAFFSVFSVLSVHSCAAEIPSDQAELFDAKLASTAVSRINAHLIINDYQNACNEALWGIYNYPQSKAVWIACIHAHAKSGDEKAMMSQWKAFIERFP